MSVLIEQGGLLTTIQDGGRFGYQQFGMTPAGAMDQYSLKQANLLVGNRRDEACLEITMLGPRLRFDAEAVLALAGGDLGARLNGQPVELYRAFRVKAGDVLSFVGPRAGCRCCLAFSGGIAIPPVLGSRSTLIRSQIGGLEGRKLKTGDLLPLNAPTVKGSLADRRLPVSDFSAGELTVRVILGPQEDRFTQKGIDTFLSGVYEVTPENDRMGYRLKGEPLEHTQGANIISDGIAFGSVQVPGSGQPIVMMADHQPTGGYTKIANVISVDLPRIAQCRAGSRLRFEAVTVPQAQELYLAQKALLDGWEAELRQLEAHCAQWPATEEDLVLCAVVMAAVSAETGLPVDKFAITSLKELAD